MSEQPEPIEEPVEEEPAPKPIIIVEDEPAPVIAEVIKKAATAPRLSRDKAKAAKQVKRHLWEYLRDHGGQTPQQLTNEGIRYSGYGKRTIQNYIEDLGGAGHIHGTIMDDPNGATFMDAGGGRHSKPVKGHTANKASPAPKAD